MDESEEGLLDRAWGLEAQSRLPCQAIRAQKGVTIDTPRYGLNHAEQR